MGYTVNKLTTEEITKVILQADRIPCLEFGEVIILRNIYSKLRGEANETITNPSVSRPRLSDRRLRVNGTALKVKKNKNCPTVAD